jgi:hypothetical protein
MAIKMTHYDDKCYLIDGSITATESSSFGATTTLNAINLVQTMGGTNEGAGGFWTTGALPALTVGQFYFTFTAGATTFRVPCWPQT